jgi:hypothetical protein
MIAPPLNGGKDFAGKIGHKTANAGATNVIETSVIAAAHFMSRGLIKLRWRGKKIFATSRINDDEKNVERFCETPRRLTQPYSLIVRRPYLRSRPD